MSRGRSSFPVTVLVSVLLHAIVLFTASIRVLAREGAVAGEGKVAFVNAVIRASGGVTGVMVGGAFPPHAASPEETASRTPPPAAPPPEEVQLEIAKTELQPAAPAPDEKPLESVHLPGEVAPGSEGLEVTDKHGGAAVLPAPSAPPGDKAPEVTEKPASPEGPRAATGQGPRDNVITQVPKAPEPDLPPAASGGGPGEAASGRAAAPPAEEKRPGEAPGETPAAAASAETKVFVPLYRVDRKPEFSTKPALVYPQKAKELGIQGTVILEADIDGNGAVTNIRVVKSIGFGLDEEAVRVLRASTFTPATAQGKAVAVKMQFPVTFTLTK